MMRNISFWAVLVVSLSQRMAHSFVPQMTRQKEFEKFVVDYEKTYSVQSSEGQEKFRNFCKISDLIHKSNGQNGRYKLGINQFADEDLPALQKKLFVCSFPHHYKQPILKGSSLHEELPSQLDWGGLGKVSRVKNQSKCGSCWAFSTTGALESMLRIRYNKSIDLSEQQLLDCSGSNYGCNGGLMDRAMDDINLMGGLYKEQDYPYTAKQESCRLDYKKIVPETSFLQYDFFRPYDIQDMKSKLNSYGPICSAVEVDPIDFIFYKEGVYNKQKSTHQLNHAVLLVGYNEEEGKFWKIKNSWGTGWGEEGYMRLAMNDDGGEGVAGLHLYGVYIKK